MTPGEIDQIMADAVRQVEASPPTPGATRIEDAVARMAAIEAAQAAALIAASVTDTDLAAHAKRNRTNLKARSEAETERWRAVRERSAVAAVERIQARIVRLDREFYQEQPEMAAFAGQAHPSIERRRMSGIDRMVRRSGEWMRLTAERDHAEARARYWADWKPKRS